MVPGGIDSFKQAASAIRRPLNTAYRIVSRLLMAHLSIEWSRASDPAAYWSAVPAHTITPIDRVYADFFRAPSRINRRARLLLSVLSDGRECIYSNIAANCSLCQSYYLHHHRHHHLRFDSRFLREPGLTGSPPAVRLHYTSRPISALQNRGAKRSRQSTPLLRERSSQASPRIKYSKATERDLSAMF